MAFEETKTYTTYSRQKHFAFFYSTGSTATTASTLLMTFDPKFDFELEKIRLHLTVAFPSVRDFMVRLAHHLSTAFNQNLMSQAMNGIQDVMWHPSATLKMCYGDVMSVSFMHSAPGFIGIEFSGWAITTA